MNGVWKKLRRLERVQSSQIKILETNSSQKITNGMSLFQRIEQEKYLKKAVLEDSNTKIQFAKKKEAEPEDGGCGR